MANIYFKCPCQKSLTIDETAKGRFFTCPDCGASNAVPAPDIRWSCPRCGTAMAAPRALNHDRIQCIECGEINQVSQAESGMAKGPPAGPSGNETIAAPVARAAKTCPTCAATVLRHVVRCPKCGFDFRSVPPPEAHAPPAPSSFWNPIHVVAIALLAGLILMATMIMLHAPRHDGPPSAPPLLPPPPASLPAAETNRPEPVPCSPADRDDAQALDYFTRYAFQLQQGNLLIAFHIFRDLQSCFTQDADLQAFLNTVIQPESQRLLTLASLCRICHRGVCQVCQGSGICLACEGDRECRVCGGMGRCERACAACSCQLCRNSGLCPICRGDKTVRCHSCQGTGKGNPVTRRIPCIPCKGKGKVPLLSGEFTCPKCNGQGFTADGVASPRCSYCSGRGVIMCSPCRGTGLCPRCRQNTWKVCALCNGIGKTTAICAFCRGSGNCPRCGERGFCPACQGAGTCPACRGASVVVSHRFLVHASWLAQDHGVMLYDTGEGRVLNASLQTGSLALAFRERPVHLEVEPHELVCLFNEPAYQWLRTFALAPAARH